MNEDANALMIAEALEKISGSLTGIDDSLAKIARAIGSPATAGEAVATESISKVLETIARRT